MPHPVIRAQADLSGRLVNNNTWYANDFPKRGLDSRPVHRLSSTTVTEAAAVRVAIHQATTQQRGLFKALP
jgi:hypothetical protein